MKRISQVLKLSVVSLLEGKTLGKIKEILVDREEKTVVAVKVWGHGLIRDEKVIALNDVVIFGEDVCIIESADNLIDPLKHNENPKLIPFDRLTGLAVNTLEGNNLGYLIDIMFETASGAVRALLLERHMIIPFVKDNAVFGEDVILVPAEAEKEMERVEEEGFQAFRTFVHRARESEAVGEWQEKVERFGLTLRQAAVTGVDYFRDAVERSQTALRERSRKRQEKDDQEKKD
ncbi:MAG: PRC-barrel domain-containing protein [Deltaproteobacteria bacterium]|nr:PRC-barrel domain-containing protein [Deltaproteobacteria bacterium]